MPTFDVRAYLEDTELKLSGVASSHYPKGHTYAVPSSLGWYDTVRLRRLMPVLTGGDLPEGMTHDQVDELLAQLLRDHDGERVTMPEKMLGEAHAEMVKDGVHPVRLDRLVGMMMIHHGYGQDAAGRIAELATLQAAESAPPARKTPAKKAATKRLAAKVTT